MLENDIGVLQFNFSFVITPTFIKIDEPLIICMKIHWVPSFLCNFTLILGRSLATFPLVK